MHRLLMTIPIVFFFLFFFLSCEDVPHAPSDIEGKISGYVVDYQDKPIKGVLVSSDADSSTPGVTNDSGYFTVGKIIQGTHTLRFTHINYDNHPGITFTLAEGYHKTLDTPVKLDYAFYKISGKVINKKNQPQQGAGVSVAGCTENTLTNTDGTFQLTKVPKKNSIVLICAHGTNGVKSRVITGLVQNTINDIGILQLEDIGATVYGTVYDSNGLPISNADVFIISDAIKELTNADGKYSIQDVPASPEGLVIFAQKDNMIGAAYVDRTVVGEIITNCNIFLRPKSAFIEGIQLIPTDIYTPSTAQSVLLRVFPLIQSDTVSIKEYIWKVNGTQYTSNLPELSIPVPGLLKENQATVEAVLLNGRAITSVNFNIFVIQSREYKIDSLSVSIDSVNYYPSVTTKKNNRVYFYTSIQNFVSGEDSLFWNFGDGHTLNTSNINQSVVHAFNNAGKHNVILRAVNANKDTAYKFVNVNIESTDTIPAPMPLIPADNSDVYTKNDTVALSWSGLPDKNVVYNLYISSVNSIPNESDLYLGNIAATTVNYRIADGTKYFWMVKAYRITDSTSSSSPVFNFTAKRGLINTIPQFITKSSDMTILMDVGNTYSDTLIATDIDNDALIFLLLNAKAGMQIAGGKFVWQPSISDTGVHNVAIKVSDPKGATDTLSWSITVKNIYIFKIARQPSNVTATVGKKAAFRIDILSQGTINYKWQKKKPSETQFTTVLDTTMNALFSSYIISSVEMDDNESLFRCLVKNGDSTIISNEVKLTIDESNVLEYNVPVFDSLSTALEVDKYYIDAVKDDKILIRLQPNGNFYSNLKLVSLTDGPIATDNSPSGNITEIKDFTIPADGRYLVTVSDQKGTSKGPYSLVVNSLKLNSIEILTNVLINDTLKYNIEVNCYSYNCFANDKISVRLQPNNNFYSNLQLLSMTDGLKVNAYSPSGKITEINDFTIPADGKYIIRVHEYKGTSKGQYFLVLNSLRDSKINSPEILSNMPINDTLKYNTEVKSYIYNCFANDVITIRLQPNNNFYSILELVSLTDGVITWRRSGSGDLTEIRDFIIPADGTYIIRVRDNYGTKKGPYTLGVYTAYMRRSNP